MADSRYDVAIVGAGVAGATLAAALGVRGYRTVVIEREKRPADRIVGELLQPGGVQELQRLGFGDWLDAVDALAVHGYALFRGETGFTIPYPGAAEGRTFRNADFVRHAREVLRGLEDVELLQGRATGIDVEADRATGLRWQDADGKTHRLQARLTVVADGIFSRLRGDLHRDKPVVTSHFVGLLLHGPTLPEPGHGHVFLGGDAPVLAYAVESDGVRVLADFPVQRAEEGAPRRETLANWLRDDVAPLLPDDLAEAVRIDATAGRFRPMPNHRLPGRPDLPASAALLGDALNMRHPLTGGGMTVALRDVRMLVDRIDTNGGIPDDIDDFYAERRTDQASINILADALHGVFRDPGLRDAVFDYLATDRDHQRDPIALISGLSRDRATLLRRFVEVAVHAARSGEPVERLRRASRILLPLWKEQDPSGVEGMLTDLAARFVGSDP